MEYGLLPIGLGTVVLAGLCWVCVSRQAPLIQEDIRTRTVAMLRESGVRVTDESVVVNGRDVTLVGPKNGTITEEATVEKVEDLWGVRSAEVKVSEEPVVTSVILPPEAARVEQELQQYLKDKTIRFANARNVIQPDGRKILDQVAAILKKSPAVAVEVSGHTDDSGDAEKNLTLSLRRAEAVKRYLVTKGTAESRLTAVGFGPDRPVADNKTEAGRARNRRIEFHAQSELMGEAARPKRTGQNAQTK